MSNPYCLCVDAYPPGDRYDPADFSPDLDAESASGQELALHSRRKWQVGQELRIRFLDGDPVVRARVQQHAESWLEFANLRFTFGNHAQSEIRISFHGDGYWSYVGKQALQMHPGRPTMVLDGFTAEADDVELRRTVLHEFGHAIGCIHEQASPNATIQWDEEKVYAYYKAWQGWDRDITYHNVLWRYSRKNSRVRRTGFDPQSIMQYHVPAELTLDGLGIGWNDDLSENDRAFIARMYPYSS